MRRPISPIPLACLLAPGRAVWCAPSVRATIAAEYHKFDPRGNWTRRVQTFRGHTISVTLREIDYYTD